MSIFRFRHTAGAVQWRSTRGCALCWIVRCASCPVEPHPTPPHTHTQARARARTHTVIAGTDGATMHPMYFNLTCAVFCPPHRRVGRSLVQLRTARAILLPRRVKPDAVGATNMIQVISFPARSRGLTVPLIWLSRHRCVCRPDRQLASWG